MTEQTQDECRADFVKVFGPEPKPTGDELSRDTWHIRLSGFRAAWRPREQQAEDK